VTKQIKEISDEMGIKLKNQGIIIGNIFLFYYIIIIDDIDSNTYEINKNAKKVNDLLENEESNKNKMSLDKKTYFIIAGIILIIIFIIVLVILIS
jgi:hypothetical protein